MKNEQYWQKRSEQILVDNEKLAVQYEKEMAKIYEEVKLKTAEQLESFYQRYAKENNLDLAEVRKRLNPAELKKFRTQQKIYLDKVNKLIEQGADLTKYNKTLEKLSAQAYVTKLQELQNNLNSEIMLLTGEQQIKLTDTLKTSYLEGYFKTMYTVQKGMGMGVTFTKPATDDVLKTLMTPWNGANYSSRIWTNKAQLTNWLNTDLPRHFAAGSSIQRMSSDLRKKLDTNQKAATRLVRTEVNHITNESAFDAYKNSGVVEEFQYLATLDGRTSDICRDMDGKVFKITEKQPGVNVPPLHPNCRSTTIPYFKEYEHEDLERIARDEDNFTYNVPASVSYKEWQKHYGNSETIQSSIKPLSTQVEQLSDLEKETLKSYTGNSFLFMNQFLSGKISKIPNQQKQMISVIDEALNKGVSPNDLVVKRVTDYDALGLLDGKILDKDTISNSLIGQTLNNLSYMSTSLGEPRLIGRQVTMIIDIPKGYKGLQYLEPIASDKYKHQHEILIKRNSKYKITNIDLQQSKPVIYVQLI